MQNYYFRFLIVAVFVLLLATIPLQAQDNDSDNAAQIIEVGIYVVGVSEFNLESGTYSVDFYLTMHCSIECNSETAGFDVVGINGTEALQIEERLLEPTYAEYRIQAVLNRNDIDLSRYPFDSHALNVMVESKFLQTDTVQYTVKEDETGIDADVLLQGWNLSHEHEVSIIEKTYYGADLGYARYIFTMRTQRVAIAAFIRSILPALVILIMSFLGTFLPDRNNRVGIAGGILLAMLLHHLAVGAEIPPVGYPVYFDAFMLLNDAAILLQFAGTVYEIVREKSGVADAILDRFSYISLVIIFIGWLLGQAIVWQVFLTIN